MLIVVESRAGSFVAIVSGAKSYALELKFRREFRQLLLPKSDEPVAG